jgi:hypothetical protein
MRANLTLHCGAATVEREQVGLVATPDNTDTWFPIPHLDFVNRVETALSAAKMRITGEAHSLTKDGNRYFGLFEIANEKTGAEDYSYVLGVRNSHDKSFPAGLVVGASVFVCDNLSFSGEIKIARKHTRFIHDDLPRLTCNAIGLLSEKWTLQGDRIAKYKETELGDKEAHDFIIRAVDAGAATVQMIPGILKEWRKPSHPEFAPRNAWSLFNGFTERAKESSLAMLPQRTISLHGLMDSQCGFNYNAGSDLVTVGTQDAEVTLARN